MDSNSPATSDRPVTSETRSGWQRELAEAVRDANELLRRLRLTPSEVGCDTPNGAAPAADFGFPVMVPESYLRRMTPGDPRDPLLLQVLPDPREARDTPGFTQDAVDDLAARAAPGLLHKYRGRALLVATGSCAVHCRYCFRRHYPYSHEPKSQQQWQPALEFLQNTPDIHEVLLSGGDPLTLTDQRLAALLEQLDRIPHVRRLRIHTRLPIVIPNRVTDRLLKLLKSLRMRVWMVLHANHEAELTGDCAEAIDRLTASGLPVLNQAVLLRRVNDTFASQLELCERLVDLGVQPYYLHQLDRVTGTAHYEVPPESGLQLMRQLREHLPGYAVPQYVTEVAGAASKLPVVVDETASLDYALPAASSDRST